MAAYMKKAAARGSQAWAREVRSQSHQYMRQQSSYSHLEEEMRARKIRPIFDDLTYQPSFRLDTALADFLPNTTAPKILHAPAKRAVLPVPHHLLYFEPANTPSDLLPDGTNPDHSPGGPFVRRMWAGGAVQYSSDNPLYLDNSRGVCVEGIRDVAIKGQPGEEKVFVGIERRLATLTTDELKTLSACSKDESQITELEENIRARIWMPSDAEFGPASIVERRNLVFMREKSNEEAKAAVAASRLPGKMLKPQHEPDFSHTLIPDTQLLFRFSALTFNAHSIHLDPRYCQEVEGHRHLLVHGPLSFLLLMTLLRKHLAKNGSGETIKSVEYRNLAPLYAYDPLKLCGRKTQVPGKWEIWAETPDGGIAVKGTVKTRGA